MFKQIKTFSETIAGESMVRSPYEHSGLLQPTTSSGLTVVVQIVTPKKQGKGVQLGSGIQKIQFSNRPFTMGPLTSCRDTMGLLQLATSTINLFYVCFVVSRISINCYIIHNFLKGTCVRQVVLDKWFPLNTVGLLQPATSSCCSNYDPNKTRHTHICISLSLYIYIYIYMHLFLSLPLSLYIYIHECIPIYFSLSLYIYIYIHTHRHTVGLLQPATSSGGGWRLPAEALEGGGPVLGGFESSAAANRKYSVV